MSLHGPGGACIPVASAPPIHVFPILKHYMDQLELVFRLLVRLQFM